MSKKKNVRFELHNDTGAYLNFVRESNKYSILDKPGVEFWSPETEEGHLLLAAVELSPKKVEELIEAFKAMDEAVMTCLDGLYAYK